MAQYIEKDALVAKIKSRMKSLLHAMSKFYYAKNYNEWESVFDEYKRLISFINTLEVKEVDLEKEIELIKGDYEQVDVVWNNDFDFIARHFFELGLKAQKGGS